ncbi:MAG: His-Xaa-Ser system radical SAM maturase HxsB [Bacteroidales bacterium]|nr:His-Xaa-Ser system radical SAM maturase HxsB [Bacteroidales bacterium]
MDYQILPYRFERIDETVFLSNEVGEHLYLSNKQFDEFVNHKLDLSSQVYNNLKSKQIIADKNIDDVVNMLATKFRTKKNFLAEFTSLHMIVVSLRCNSNCSYCQVSKKEKTDFSFDMTKKIAKKVIEKIFETPSNSIKIEFQGGEAMINFDIIKYIIEKAEWTNIFKKKKLEFVICTNLTLLDVKMLKWLKGHKVYISTSIDGPKELHNINRPLLDIENSYDLVTENIELCRKYLGKDSVSALMTTTSFTINHFKEIIDKYVELDFDNIFLRSLNPYGFAKRDKHKLAYPMEEFIDNYKKGLDYIIEINKKGKFFAEGFATILLTRILTPFSTGFVDLQSPAGTAIAGVIYDYDGDVYVSDEGRMLAAVGDKQFRMGNVETNTYQEIFNSEYLHELINNSVAESLPECATCAYLSYCGADPVRNYNEQGDVVGNRTKSEICLKNKSIIKYLLSLLQKNDTDINRVFWSWITRKTIEE